MAFPLDTEAEYNLADHSMTFIDSIHNVGGRLVSSVHKNVN